MVLLHSAEASDLDRYGLEAESLSVGRSRDDFGTLFFAHQRNIFLQNKKGTPTIMTQSMENAARQMATSEVQNTFPDVYRAANDLRNHAYTIAQQQVQNSSAQANPQEFAVQHYAEAYIEAYRHAVEERDAQK